MLYILLIHRVMRYLERYGIPFQNQRLDKIESYWGVLVQQDPAFLYAYICVASSDIAVKAGESPHWCLLDPIKVDSDSLIAAVHAAGHRATEEDFNGELLYVEYTLHSNRYMRNGDVKGDAFIEGSSVSHASYSIAPPPRSFILQTQTSSETTNGPPNGSRNGHLSGYFYFCQHVVIWMLVMGACSCNSIVHERGYGVTN
ncbi:hypothetical protein BO78DRAFT_427596 [Aspergillus sclerotiicarbonarius CBS 121057]|uniref:Uncharacterized protein n=1 Tax=Aspergillus sclerotiicarbonarius (strain CBS 121057 / IBT 28362) TaxID=1448318 RepID=A0A319ENL2_ASPSB|nr:hypothetical protein BO78DRAFT_427596 [Aspergillus sclerotiicarbonarius CBS 121057]